MCTRVGQNSNFGRSETCTKNPEGVRKFGCIPLRRVEQASGIAAAKIDLVEIQACPRAGERPTDIASALRVTRGAVYKAKWSTPAGQ